MKPYHHFTQKERESIYLLLKQGKKVSVIANELGRNKSSVSREISRNCNKATGDYHPFEAEEQYKQRRKKCRRKYRIRKRLKLYQYICEKLKQYWSPEIIACMWNQNNEKKRISFSTIYNALKRNVFTGITPKTHLRRRGKKKYGKRNKFNTIQPEHTIHERPEQANIRARVNDWEGDTVRSSPGKGCLVTYVDRKSRKLIAAKSNDMSSKSILEATKKAFKGIQAKTITLDNGSEFALFKDIEKELNTTVYFADPHSPWQRGSNENTNGLLRFFFPRGFDFRTLTDEKLQEIVDLINNRPKLCLDLLSPNEVFLLHLD